ncbi:MAG: RNA polymerase sigma factor [Gammaproteobacteria bacterium]|nr:RNA polymerase sigma factor [Gammaproteobacteria bacterium]
MDRKLTKQRQEELVDVLPNIRRFAMSITGSLADADDLLQTTVERALTRGIPDNAEVLPWCLRVCKNLWIDEMRSQKVRRDATTEPAVIGEQVLDGERQMHGEMTLEEVQTALHSMSDEHRMVLELVAVEGFSYKDAAAALEIPVGTVMSRLARARTALLESSGFDASPAH